MNNWPTIINAQDHPTLVKVKSLHLPISTIKDFVLWLAKETPDLIANNLAENVDGILCSYYNIDRESMAVELASLHK